MIKIDNFPAHFHEQIQNAIVSGGYEDLFMRFANNTELRAHRVILATATTYFSKLDELCVDIGGVYIMPQSMQSDVIIPIVQYIYTGQIKFNMSDCDQLIRAATEMEMSDLVCCLRMAKQVNTQNESLATNTSTTTMLAKLTLVEDQPSDTNSSAGRSLPGKHILLDSKAGTAFEMLNGIERFEPSLVLSMRPYGMADQKRLVGSNERIGKFLPNILKRCSMLWGWSFTETPLTELMPWPIDINNCGDSTKKRQILGVGNKGATTAQTATAQRKI